jgi:hypothetical protein
MSKPKANDSREPKPMRIELRKLDRVETTAASSGNGGA